MFREEVVALLAPNFVLALGSSPLPQSPSGGLSNKKSLEELRKFLRRLGQVGLPAVAEAMLEEKLRLVVATGTGSALGTPGAFDGVWDDSALASDPDPEAEEAYDPSTEPSPPDADHGASVDHHWQGTHGWGAGLGDRTLPGHLSPLPLPPLEEWEDFDPENLFPDQL
jgi:hypothetical protein